MFNRYSYTLNDPVNMIDLDGENPALVIAKIAQAAYIGAASGGAAAAVTSGKDTIGVGMFSGGIAGALTSFAPPQVSASTGSISGQVFGQMSANKNAGRPTTANMKLDIPVTVGSTAGAYMASPTNKALSKSIIKNTDVVGKVLSKSGPKYSNVGKGMGAVADGVGSGFGELVGGLVGNALEVNGVKTNIQLTNSDGNLDVRRVFSNRYNRPGMNPNTVTDCTKSASC